MGVGEKIKAIRKNAGITQEMLAKYLDVSKQTISKWESAAAEPDWRSMVKLSRFFELPLEEFAEELESIEPLQEEKITYKELMETFQKERRKTIILIAAMCLILLGALSMIGVVIVNSSIMSIQYMLYRFIVVNEYAFAPENYVLPIVVSILAIVVGMMMLLIGKRK